MTTPGRNDHLENEWFHIRHSGETPEIAFHSALYYLSEDVSGPRLHLEEAEITYLLGAAKERYRDIIFRDILPDNRDTTVYRGLLRTICNWRRFKRFCGRHDLDWHQLQKEVANQVITFLKVEIDDVENRRRESCINCTGEDLRSFTMELNINLVDIHHDIDKFCCQLAL